MGNDHTAMMSAQDIVRARLSEMVKGAGSREIAPLAKGSVEFQEMMRIGRAKYSLVPADFINAFRNKPKHFLALPGSIIGTVKEVAKEEEIKDSLRGWRYTADDEKNNPGKKQGKLNADKVREVFLQVKKSVKKDWGLLKYEQDGQIPVSVVARGLMPGLSNFLCDKDFELLDKWITKINEDANLSRNQFEKYRNDALKALDKTTNPKEKELKKVFLPEDWDFVRRMVMDIWGEKSELYLDLKDITFTKATDNTARAAIRDKIARKPLPPVQWDGSVGAQLMRYTLGGTVQAELALLKKGKLAIGADGEFDAALGQAKAEGHFTWPNTEGYPLRPKIKVRREQIVYKRYGNSAQSNFYSLNRGQQLPYFAVDCSLLTPAGAAGVFSVLKHWSVLAQTANRSRTDVENRGLFLQVVGHTSATGADQHNQVLGLRRAGVVADFVSQHHFEWHNHFRTGVWGEAEIEFMGYTLLIMRGGIKAQVDWMQLGWVDRKIPLIQQLKQQVSGLDEARRKLPAQVVNQVFVSRSKWNEPFETGKPGKRLGKLQQLISMYIQTLIVFASRQNNVPLGWHNNILNGIKLYSTPYISKGEAELAIDTNAETFRNRRCDFVAWEIDQKNSKIVPEEVEVHFGEMRLQVTGHLSGWAGANIQLGGKVELACPQGMLAVVGAIREDHKTGKVSKQTKNKMKGALAAEANAGLFAGVKAELGLKGALEWRPPAEEPEKGKKYEPPEFGALASVGWTVTGMIGAGGSAEFTIGFDRTCSRFVIKMEAGVCLGPGFGGQIDLVVGVGQCWDFIMLVHGVLRRNNFKYVDVFETADMESGLDVYELFCAWTWRLMREYGYVPGAHLAGAAVVGAGAVVAVCVELLDNYSEIVRDWQQQQALSEQTELLVETLHRKPDLLRFLPPEAKGRILYELICVPYSWNERWENLINLDTNRRREEAALVLILQGVHSRADWRETLEHLGQIKNGFLVPNIATGESEAAKAMRVHENIRFLRLALINDLDDWERVESYIKTLPE